MDRQEIARWRMHNQRLWGARWDRPEEALRHLAAVQAQEFAYAKWSLAQRVVDGTGNGATRDAVSKACDDGLILRTHLLRPTWHFVLPEDIRWMLVVTAPRVHALNAFQYRTCGLDATIFAKSKRLFSKALQGGRQLTRAELVAVLEGAGIAAAGIGLACILMNAELDAVICSGAMRGKQQTYALLDDRVPQASTLTREEGLAELARRYFTSRGPATLKDYLRWSSLTTAEGKRGLEIVKSQLEFETSGGRTYWFAAPLPATIAPASPTVDLIQAYDEYGMSYSESRDVLASVAASGENAAPANGRSFLHVMLLDGHYIGRWKHTIERSGAIVEVQPIRPFKAKETRALKDAVKRYGEFLGVPVRERIG